MKKHFILVSAITAIGLGSFFMACDDDDKATKLPTCKCTMESSYYYDEETATLNLSDEDDMDEWDLEVGDIKTCKELADYIEDESSYYESVSCKTK
jgi:hypothetical protein